MIVVKKYGNRRLYDTGDSRYITLEELAAKIRAGAEVRVVDAKTDKDLTQATLTQIIIESRGAARLLPVALLIQLIRMGDDALAEFFGRFLTTALDLYARAQQGAQALPYNPFGGAAFGGGDALARLFTPAARWPAPQPAQPEPPAPSSSELADLRRELQELKQSLRRKPRR